MRRAQIPLLSFLLALASLALAQEPPGESAAEPETEGGPVLSEELSDEAIWSEDATGSENDSGFIPSEAISADAAIAFPIDI